MSRPILDREHFPCDDRLRDEMYTLRRLAQMDIAQRAAGYYSANYASMLAGIQPPSKLSRAQAIAAEVRQRRGMVVKRIEPLPGIAR